MIVLAPAFGRTWETLPNVSAITIARKEEAMDEKERKVVNHWGTWVRSDRPVTGVLNINSAPEWILEEQGIDLGCLKCPARRKGTECEFCEQRGDQLLGTWKRVRENHHLVYVPDPKGTYSAILREDVIQIILSKTTRTGALCSPCYPGQVDLDTPGDFLGYCLPDPLEGWDYGGGIDDPRY